MTREEILRMAQSVGFYLIDFIDGDSVTEQIEAETSEAIYKFAHLVAAVEREACAGLCDELVERNRADAHVAWVFGNSQCADAIRARGEQA